MIPFPLRAGLAVLLVTLAAPAGRAADESEAVRAAILRMTNEFRKSQKRPPLKVNKVLAETAQKHAANMARQDRYGDDGKNGHVLDGKGMKDRVGASGYKGAGWGENVGRTSESPRKVRVMMNAWKKSAGHRKNLLSPSWDETGVGTARSRTGQWYFCHLFGRTAAPVTKLSVTLENQTEAAIDVRGVGEAAGHALEAGGKMGMTVRSADPKLEIRKTPTGLPVVVPLRDKARYVITPDGKGLKVEEKKEP
jgi:uncharacterized protein YkwD